MFTNRIGDFFLTIGFFAIFFTFGSLDYSTVFSLAPYINTNVITFIAILLLLGAAAKSAQLGLHIWLPQAMEGPTPVSALIHAATMVTAGVYMVCRMSFLYATSTTALTPALRIAGAAAASTCPARAASARGRSVLAMSCARCRPRRRSNGSPINAITVASDKTVTCTFNNAKDATVTSGHLRATTLRTHVPEQRVVSQRRAGASQPESIEPEAEPPQ